MSLIVFDGDPSIGYHDRSGCFLAGRVSMPGRFDPKHQFVERHGRHGTACCRSSASAAVCERRPSVGVVGDEDNNDDEPGIPEDDGNIGGVTWEQFYRSQLFASIHAQPDSLLQALIWTTNKELMTFGVTVFTHGFAVSGLVVGISEWLNDLAAHIENKTQDGWVIGAAYRQMALEHTVASATEDADDDPPPTPQPIWIHLENAAVFQAGVGLATGQFIRLRLSEISGWMLTQLASPA
jgi:hypothetical protein